MPSSTHHREGSSHFGLRPHEERLGAKLNSVLTTGESGWGPSSIQGYFGEERLGAKLNSPEREFSKVNDRRGPRNFIAVPGRTRN